MGESVCTSPASRHTGAGDIAASHQGLAPLLEKVYRERGFDFREYRKSTLGRRLGRRLRLCGVRTYAEYARVLDQDPVEYDRLFNDLTINVTSFFRDEIAFKALERVVWPALLYNNTEKWKGLQIWSAGCATGAEPYSIAMLLLELSDGDIGKGEITILATDIDVRALQRAREGVFAPKEVEGIRPVWRAKYFAPKSDGFRVQPVLRQLVTFAAHNLVSDPPYRGLDLVVCRNVLIYFTPELQTRVLKGFHEGLKEGGGLLLGKAEVPVGETRSLFYAVDGKAKLFRKTGQAEERDGKGRG